MNFLKSPSKNGDKITNYYDFGRGKGQLSTTGFFIYTKAKNQAEKKNNREALLLLKTKRAS